jgi:hypothetical protein
MEGNCGESFNCNVGDGFATLLSDGFDFGLNSEPVIAFAFVFAFFIVRVGKEFWSWSE